MGAKEKGHGREGFKFNRGENRLGINHGRSAGLENIVLRKDKLH